MKMPTKRGKKKGSFEILSKTMNGGGFFFFFCYTMNGVIDQIKFVTTNILYIVRSVTKFVTIITIHRNKFGQILTNFVTILLEC